MQAHVTRMECFLLSVTRVSRYHATGDRKGRTIRKVMGGVGDFWAPGIFFCYQIPCMNFF